MIKPFSKVLVEAKDSKNELFLFLYVVFIEAAEAKRMNKGKFA